MVSSPADRLAPARGPRHALDDGKAIPTGRHRRPESLADSAPAPFAPARPGHAEQRAHPIPAADTGRRAERRTGHVSPAEPGTHTGRRAHHTRSAGADLHHADEVIREARQAAYRLAQTRAEAAPVRSGHRRAHPARAQDRHTGRQTAPRRHAATARGRHALPPDPLGITVRPLRADPAGDPATGDRRPVTGSRRAPGTLPIESWLLIGRGRQQALLASLVAAGLALVMIPAVAQRGTDEVNPVNAAGRATTVTAPAPGPSTGADVAAGRSARRPAPAAPETSRAPGQPAASAPAAGTPPPPAPTATVTEAPLAVVPPGDGPFRSWRTTGDATVALTFDDGPDPVQTPRILAMLAEYDVKATFCLVGVQVVRHPEIVRQIVEGGHTLCNHTWDHNLTIGRDEPEAIATDLARTNRAIRNVVPDAPVPFFRAPGGNFSDRLVQVAYREGMTSLHWEVDPRDWQHAKGTDDARHVKRIVRTVRDTVRPGAIVLSHDFNQPDTVDAYAELLPWLTANFSLGVPAVPAPPADS